MGAICYVSIIQNLRIITTGAGVKYKDIFKDDFIDNFEGNYKDKF